MIRRNRLRITVDQLSLKCKHECLAEWCSGAVTLAPGSPSVKLSPSNSATVTVTVRAMSDIMSLFRRKKKIPIMNSSEAK
jgi:hypothetical protein